MEREKINTQREQKEHWQTPLLLCNDTRAREREGDMYGGKGREGEMYREREREVYREAEREREDGGNLAFSFPTRAGQTLECCHLMFRYLGSTYTI